MINKIKIEVEINPTAINYFYGSNGSGKTTISKVINNYTKYPTCDITYSNPSNQIMVYNNDFAKENFSQSVSVRGIFTLGKYSKDCMDFIENANKEIENLKP
ncbi:AAA family ATPase [Clostridioides sp. ES-S-0108-01]|uniref:AAA family ATPase n=1 Tax=Clostridioides sp. ES-S-0108-01 TaxID=2770773 RepID=UPI001D0C7B10|nr:AAA family ATPase [Clostridioides sp. ES-S-0108-01]UDN51181.1 AAA family ATPase [Clostridioides sp. ES-S-0107-01]